MDFELRQAREKLVREQKERKERARRKLEKERKANEQAKTQREAIEAAQRSRRLDAAEAQLKVSIQSPFLSLFLLFFVMDMKHFSGLLAL